MGNENHKPDCACPWCRNGRKEPAPLRYIPGALTNPPSERMKALRASSVPELVFLDRGCSEWSFAWGRVPTTELSSCKEPGCPCVESPDSGESWQYMGTEPEARRHGALGVVWYHTFRHRDYPGTGQREYWRVQASPEWSRDQNDGTHKHR
jgi:hypothetical protein